MAYCPSTAPTAPKAQQLPHCPWFLTSFIISFQSWASGAEAWAFLNLLSTFFSYQSNFFNEFIISKIFIFSYQLSINNLSHQNSIFEFIPGPVSIEVDALFVSGQTYIVFSVVCFNFFQGGHENSLINIFNDYFLKTKYVYQIWHDLKACHNSRKCIKFMLYNYTFLSSSWTLLRYPFLNWSLNCSHGETVAAVATQIKANPRIKDFIMTI